MHSRFVCIGIYIEIATHTPDMVINCNLVALALILFINNLKKRILLEQEMQVITIGEDLQVDN